MGSPLEHTVDAACPACARAGLLLATVEVDIPYFGRSVQTVLRCPSCGFRHADFLILEQRSPVRWVVPIQPDTLDARVVRSTSGTWRIPELGFVAEPSAASESFVTNVEGMLDRARDIVVAARGMVEDEDRKAIADGLLVRIDRLVAGLERGTLILEDPHGNSAVASPHAKQVPLSEEEAAALATGVVVFDKDEFG